MIKARLKTASAKIRTFLGTTAPPQTEFPAALQKVNTAGRRFVAENFYCGRKSARHEDDGAATVCGAQGRAAVADLADDLALLVYELELAHLREAVQLDVARPRGDGHQSEARLGADAELYVALRRIEDVSPSAQKLRVEEDVAHGVLGHDGLRAYARQLDVALARDVRANHLAVDVSDGDVAAHRADVNGRARGDLNLEVDVAHVLAVVAPHVYADAVAADLRRHLRRRRLHRGRDADAVLVPRDDLYRAGAVEELEAYVRLRRVLTREAALRERGGRKREEGERGQRQTGARRAAMSRVCRVRVGVFTDCGLHQTSETSNQTSKILNRSARR